MSTVTTASLSVIEYITYEFDLKNSFSLSFRCINNDFISISSAKFSEFIRILRRIFLNK